MFNHVRSILLISVASIQCASTTRPRSVSAVSSAQSRCSFIRRRRYTVKWLSRLRHLQVQTPTLAEGAQCASDMNACHPSYGPAKEQTKNCQIGRRLNRIAKRQMVRDHWVSTRVSFMRRSSTRTLLVAPFPGIETPDYHEVSLREKQPLRFGEERHLMVARPFRAGMGCDELMMSRSDNWCAIIGNPHRNHSCVAPRRGGCWMHRFRGLKPPATIGSRSARNSHCDLARNGTSW